MANQFGAKGIPTGGYPSQRQFRLAMRNEKRKDVAERVSMLAAGKKRIDDHFQLWISERCSLLPAHDAGRTFELDTPIKVLLASYREWCATNGSRPAPEQTWGRWMSKHFLKMTRNARGVTRVYCGISLKAFVALPVEDDDPTDIDPWTGKPVK